GDYIDTTRTITVIGGGGQLFVDFTLPQEQLEQVSVGMPARFAMAGRIFTGAIAALDPSLSTSTRAVTIRAAVDDDEGILRPGMLVEVNVVLPERNVVVAVPATAVIHAPYGDSVFLLEDLSDDYTGARETRDGNPILVARQSFVRVGAHRGDFAALVAGVP